MCFNPLAVINTDIVDADDDEYDSDYDGHGVDDAWS